MIPYNSFIVIEVPVFIQESERLCICLLKVSIFPVLMIFSIGFWNCSDSGIHCFSFYCDMKCKHGILEISKNNSVTALLQIVLLVKRQNSGALT